MGDGGGGREGCEAGDECDGEHFGCPLRELVLSRWYPRKCRFISKS
jgi:hypothetical protein